MAVARLAEGDTAGVLFLMTVYFLLKIASKVFKTTSLIVERKLYNDVYEKVQNQMVKKLDRIDMNTFTACNKGELLNIVNGDTRVLAEFGTWLSQAVLLLFFFDSFSGCSGISQSGANGSRSYGKCVGDLHSEYLQ